MPDSPPPDILSEKNGDEKNHYEVLGISPNASTEEIKRAYKKRILEHHPDKNAEDSQGSTRRFTRIQDAYETLIDNQKRSHYDQQRHTRQFHDIPPSNSYDHDFQSYPFSPQPFFLFTFPNNMHEFPTFDQWPSPLSGTARPRVQRPSPFPSPTFQSSGRNYSCRQPTNPYECLQEDLQEFLT